MILRNTPYFPTLLLFTLFMFSNTIHAQKLETVAHIDLERYAGLWYEIASYPNRFQKDAIVPQQNTLCIQMAMLL
jgi:lipocalin